MSKARAKKAPTKFGKLVSKIVLEDPDHATSVALDALTQPPRIKPNDAERSLLSRATSSWIHVGQPQIAVRIYTFADPSTSSANLKTVLMSPGFGLAALSLLAFVPPLLSHGFRVVLYDPVALGESEGKIWDLDLLLDILVVLANTNQPLAGLIGHSVGGTSMAATLANHPDITCPRMVCLSPPMQMRTVMDEFLYRLGVEQDIINTIGERLIRIAKDKGRLLPEGLREMIKVNGNNIRSEVLITYSLDDPVVSVEEERWFNDQIAGSHLEFVNGLKHYGSLRSKDVIKMAIDFMVNGPKHAGLTKL